MNKMIIAWDLGATKCTAGLLEYLENADDFVCKKEVTIKLRAATSLEDLCKQLESQLAFSLRDADAICIGAAGFYNGEELVLENPYPYPMTFAKLAKEECWPPFAVIHDYAPIVCATFTSYMNHASNVKRLNAKPLHQHERRVALGIGTGLGLKDGVLLKNGDFWLGQNEIGHIGITAPPQASPFYLNRHHEWMRFLQYELQQEKNTPITFEKILSGSGMARLYQFFYPKENPLLPEEVGAKVRAGLAPEVLAAFSWYLGLFVGCVQLSFMPPGGIWITGGVALHHLDAFDHPDFFAGIHASPAYLNKRQEYPLGVLCNANHALIGGAYYAIKRLC